MKNKLTGKGALILMECELELELAVRQFRANPYDEETRKFLKRAFTNYELAEKLVGVAQ